MISRSLLASLIGLLISVVVNAAPPDIILKKNKQFLEKHVNRLAEEIKDLESRLKGEPMGSPLIEELTEKLGLKKVQQDTVKEAQKKLESGSFSDKELKSMADIERLIAETSESDQVFNSKNIDRKLRGSGDVDDSDVDGLLHQLTRQDRILKKGYYGKKMLEPSDFLLQLDAHRELSRRLFEDDTGALRRKLLLDLEEIETNKNFRSLFSQLPDQKWLEQNLSQEGLRKLLDWIEKTNREIELKK